MAIAVLYNGGGSGVDSDALSTKANNVLKGYQYIGNDTDGEVGVGTLEFSSTANPSDVTKGKTFYKDSTTQLVGTLVMDGNAQPSNVISGKKYNTTDAYNKNTGTLTFNGTAQASDVLKDKTFYNTSHVRQTGTLEFTGNAAASQVLRGQTFYNNSTSKNTGSMAIYEGTDCSDACGPIYGNVSYDYYLSFGGSYTIPSGFHDGKEKIRATDLSATTANASMIVKNYKAYYCNGGSTRTLLTGTAGV